MKFLIEKYENGKWAENQKRSDALKSLPPKKYWEEITPFHRAHTDKQRKWLFGSIYARMFQPLIDAGCDHITSIDEVHKFCKVLIGGKNIVNKYTGEVVKIPTSTKKMTTVEFCTYCDKCRDYALEFLGEEIPDPIEKEFREKQNL